MFKLRKQKHPKSRTCRYCGEKGTMAIEYGEEEGLCKPCLIKLLPLALKK